MIAIYLIELVFLIGAVALVVSYFDLRKQNVELNRQAIELHKKVFFYEGRPEKEPMALAWSTIAEILKDWKYDPYMDTETPCCERVWRKGVGDLNYEISISGTPDNPRDFELVCWDTTDDPEDGRFWNAETCQYFERSNDLIAFMKSDLDASMEVVRRGRIAMRPETPSVQES